MVDSRLSRYSFQKSMSASSMVLTKARPILFKYFVRISTEVSPSYMGPLSRNNLPPFTLFQPSRLRICHPSCRALCWQILTLDSTSPSLRFRLSPPSSIPFSFPNSHHSYDFSSAKRVRLLLNLFSKFIIVFFSFVVGCFYSFIRGIEFLAVEVLSRAQLLWSFLLDDIVS